MAQYAAEPSQPKHMSLEEWAALDEDERGELVDGALEEEEMPSAMHELVIAWLIGVLQPWARAHGALVLGSGAKVKTSPRSGRMPDLSVYLRDRRPPPRGLIDVPPSIAVEVVTPTPRDERRDRIEKLNEYASVGIKWYWLVDPELRTFEVLELGPDGRYVHAQAAAEGVIREVAGCDGLSIDLGALWAEIDALLEEPATS